MMHKRKTITLFNRQIELVGVQIDIVEQLQLGPKTAMQIVAAIGKPEKTVRNSLYILQHDRNCIAQLTVLKEKGKRGSPVWFVSENDPNKPKPVKIKPGPKPVDKELEAENRELKKKKSIADEYIKKHLAKPITKFGWLVENAGAAQLTKKTRGTKCRF